MNNYKPKPIDTSNVNLPDDVLQIAELLAKNTHDIWAQARFNDGWIYGNIRDNKAKTNPCLIPYEELPESEKEYDRRTSKEVLAVLYAMGYRLVK